MKSAVLGLLAVASALTGCTQKSDVDKCVEAWEATVKDIPDDDQKRVGFYEGRFLQTKAEARYSQRLTCMMAAGKKND